MNHKIFTMCVCVCVCVGYYTEICRVVEGWWSLLLPIPALFHSTSPPFHFFNFFFFWLQIMIEVGGVFVRGMYSMQGFIESRGGGPLGYPSIPKCSPEN